MTQVALSSQRSAARLDQGVPSATHARAATLMLAAAVVVVGSCVAAWNLERGLWLDEFITIARTDPALSPSQFWRLMTAEQHPIGHYGLIYLARKAGVEGVVALRMLSLLGVAWVVLALAGAARKRALSVAQACVIAELYVSSKAFFVYAAELRGYHLCYAGSIALSCAWLRLQRGDLSARSLTHWGMTIFLLSNTHYYALLFSGFLTVFLLVLSPSVWSRGGRLRFAATSLLGALPAVTMWAIQAHETLNGKYFKYVSASPGESVRMAAHLFFDVTGFSLPAYVCVGLVLIGLWRRRGLDLPRDLFALAGVAAATYALLLTANAIVPLLRPRYLIAAGAGALTVAVGGLAVAREVSPGRLGAIGAFALVVQLVSPTFAWFAPQYWKKSARVVADAVQSCPSTTVYAATEVHPDVQQRRETPALWLTGYRHYARELGFDVTPLPREGSVRPGAQCPSLIWMEHIQRHVGAPVADVLAALHLNAQGEVSVRYADSGGVVWVR